MEQNDIQNDAPKQPVVEVAEEKVVEIEEKTRKSLTKNKKLLENISKERIRDEFSKTLLGKDIKPVLNEYRNIIEVFVPELSEVSPDKYKKAVNDISRSKEVLEMSDKKIKIPMLGKTESLNAAVATGVILYEYVRQNFAK